VKVAKVPHLLLFGGTGAIGSAIGNCFRDDQWKVTTVTRSTAASNDVVSWNPLGELTSDINNRLEALAPFDAVCWAQGKNCNDTIYSFDETTHHEMYNANVLYILKSLNILLAKGLLAKPARLCIISSIWQNIARQNKLSYGVTKAALHGLVLSAANDLGKEGHLVNAVLPGALDTQMTRQNLGESQIDKIAQSTQFGRLPTVYDVAQTAHFLCSHKNTGVTGQFIKVDLGYSDVRVI
jgi:3-oxoacyl-[acyl-carrier protein] reductase